MNCMGKLVDQYIFGMILVDLISQDILFRTSRERIFGVTTQAAGTDVPVECRIVCQKSMFGNIGRPFITRHNADAGIAVGERLHDFCRQCVGHCLDTDISRIETAVGNTP